MSIYKGCNKENINPILRDITNCSTDKKTGKRLPDNVMATHIKAFYCMPPINGKALTVSNYLEDSKITANGGAFRRQWKDSGLQEAKKRGVPFVQAATLFDTFQKSERERQALKNKRNATSKKSKGSFTIYQDPPASNNFQKENQIVKIEKDGQDSKSDNCTSNSDCGKDIEEILEPETKVEAGKKVYAKKLEDAVLRDMISEFFYYEGSMKQYMESKGKSKNYRTILNRWKEAGLEYYKENSEPLVNALKVYDAWMVTQKEKQQRTNKQNAQTQKILPKEFEVFMCILIEQLALFGKGIGRNTVKKMIEGCLKEYTLETKRNAFSTSTYDRLLNRYDLKCKNVKNIDPVRVNQVTPENRAVMFANLDAVVQLIHEIDPINCPWNSWETVPPRFKYNMDETSTDPTRHRNQIVWPRWCKDTIFKSTPQGDKMFMHITLCMFSRGDGLYRDKENKIDGSPMPILSHTKSQSKSKSSTKKPGDADRQQRLDLYNEDENTYIELEDKYVEGLNEDNPLDLTVRATHNGSMKKDTYLDAMIHFTRNLPTDQGKEGFFSFLLLDSHVSRWNPKAIVWCFENRVIPYYFPSHLTIHIQPQDNGVIAKVHRCINDAEEIPRLSEETSTIALMNATLEVALTDFRDSENETKRERASNCTTWAWGYRTGLEPANQMSNGWKEALQTFGRMNGLKIKNGQQDVYAAFVKVDRPTFSNEDINLIEKVAVNKLGNENCPTVADHPLAKCYQIVCNIIDDWVQADYNDKDPIPVPKTAAELAAIKYVEIRTVVAAEHSGAEQKLLSNKEKMRDRVEAVVLASKKRDVIEVCPIENDAEDDWSKAMKLDCGDWLVVVDGEKKVQVSSDDLLGENWVVNATQVAADSNKIRQSRAQEIKEKDELLMEMAKLAGRQEREAAIKSRFIAFNNLPKKERTFEIFKNQMLDYIKSPSEHNVTVKLDGEDYTIDVAAYEQGSAAMRQLVTSRILQNLIQVSEQRSELGNKQKRKKRNNKVGFVRKGSDGFRKLYQIDAQNEVDVENIRKEKIHRNKKLREKLVKRWNAAKEFEERVSKKNIWQSDGLLRTTELKGVTAAALLEFFGTKGVGGKSKEQKITIVEDMLCSKASFEATKEKLRSSLIEEGIEVECDTNSITEDGSNDEGIEACSNNQSSCPNSIEEEWDSSNESEDSSKDETQVLEGSDEEDIILSDDDTVEVSDDDILEDTLEVSDDDILEGSDEEDIGSSDDTLERSDEEKTNSIEDFEPYIGMKIQKDFKGVNYIGTIESGPNHVKDKRGKISKQWQVLYEDGDKEDMNFEELFDYYDGSFLDDVLMRAHKRLVSGCYLRKEDYIALITAKGVEVVNSSRAGLQKQWESLE